MSADPSVNFDFSQVLSEASRFTSSSGTKKRAVPTPLSYVSDIIVSDSIVKECFISLRLIFESWIQIEFKLNSW